MGRRVVVRYRLADGRATDVLGELVTWDALAGELVVLARSGPVRVALTDLLLGKPVPARAVRRLGVAALQDVMADGWRPQEQEHYGGWRLRAAGGFTGRANSVLPIGAPPAPLGEAVDHVERWYAERSLPARFAIPWALRDAPPERDEAGRVAPSADIKPDELRMASPTGVPSRSLDLELERRGYELDTPTLVLTCSVDPALLRERGSLAAESRERSASGEPAMRLAVDVRDQPDAAWLSLYHYRGKPLPDNAIDVLTSAPWQRFASLRTPTGEVAAVGRVAVSRGWAGITAVEVAPDRRRQGLGRAIMAGLLDVAVEAGAQASYLQVARANRGARALYAALGYTEHSGYHYRIQP